jgi:hypothetical protein
MNNEKEQKKEYESPKMEVIELQHKAEILNDSPIPINWNS